MFQYVAARLAAQRLGCQFLISQGWFSWRDALRRRSSITLFRVFPGLYPGVARGCLDFAERHARRFAVRFEQRVFRNRFRPWSPSVAPYEGLEGYHPGYLELPKFTRLEGYFQSPFYMQGHEDHVRGWFGAAAAETVEVGRRWSEAGIDPQETVAVHVRLGDYRRQVPIGSSAQGGWLLPPSYYRRALEFMGDGRRIALFSDEPDAAVEYLGCRVDYVSRTADARVDLRMMSSCRRMIIGNSTYSWWAAWLNTLADRQIVAPEYFLGRNLEVWYPRDIRVEGWTYL